MRENRESPRKKTYYVLELGRKKKEQNCEQLMCDVIVPGVEKIFTRATSSEKRTLSERLRTNDEESSASASVVRSYAMENRMKWKTCRNNNALYIKVPISHSM